MHHEEVFFGGDVFSSSHVGVYHSRHELSFSIQRKFKILSDRKVCTNICTYIYMSVCLYVWYIFFYMLYMM